VTSTDTTPNTDAAVDAPAAGSSRAVAFSRLQVLAAAALFSTGGAAIKGTTLTAWQVAGLRSGIAALTLLVLIPRARRHWSVRNWIVGLVYASTLVLFVTANKLTTSASAIFLQATGPLYVLLAAPWLLKEHVRRQDLYFMLAMALGLASCFVDRQVPLATAPNPFAGNIAAALSGVTWGFTVMGLRWVGSRDAEASLNTVVAGNLCAAMVCLPWALPLHATSMDWAALVWLGVFQIGFAYLLLSTGVQHVTALDAARLLLAEPVLNPVWAWAVHGERPGAWALSGGALILAATLARTLAPRLPSRP
jgi:drug/metabolite transporter (DMT)-like permease